MTTQIYVLDAGGQYCHLIARKVRELGVYSEIRALGTPAAALREAKGIIVSGGPSSVTAPDSPSVDQAIYALGVPILGICYGHQLMARDLGGRVSSGLWKEYGRAVLEVQRESGLFEGTPPVQRAWMSHGDTVLDLPHGFVAVAATADCKVAAACDPARRIYGVQFHPEVVHTEYGTEILRNFVTRICGATPDWEPARNLERLREGVRRRAGGKKVFFLVSGGVDSTVAFLLTFTALGRERVRGLCVDTGFLRKGETEAVRRAFEKLGVGEDVLSVVDRSGRFLAALERTWDPEAKRKAIGRLFVEVQNEEFAALRAGDGDWLLGQGTIYPDTIESGGTALAAKIKTHHNRVDEIGALIAAGRVIEPLVELYKDEVRAVGRELGLPESVVGKHPFPGPGLAIRCLCAPEGRPVVMATEDVAEVCRGRDVTPWVVPVRTVGVQGDERTYSQMVALSGAPTLDAAAALGRAIANRVRSVNRIVAVLHARVPLGELRLREDYLRRDRLDLLREVDATVMEVVRDHGWYDRIWQFPVGLLPLDRDGGHGETVLLRPVNSRDGMTADHVDLDARVITELVGKLSGMDRVAAIFYDVTDKPPATIELE